MKAFDRVPTGRDTPIATSDHHAVNGEVLKPAFRQGYTTLVVGMGCFWGVERLFWSLPGVLVTAVGYAGGKTPNPTYDEVCSELTGHAEVVLILFDPSRTDVNTLLKVFWENHDPTQLNRQGNDIGSQYRSAIYTTSGEQYEAAIKSAKVFQQQLDNAGQGHLTTEIKTLETFYYAEAYHQQYLHKNPGGYCGLKGTGISCPIG